MQQTEVDILWVRSRRSDKNSSLDAGQLRLDPNLEFHEAASRDEACLGMKQDKDVTPRLGKMFRMNLKNMERAELSPRLLLIDKDGGRLRM